MKKLTIEGTASVDEELHLDLVQQVKLVVVTGLPGGGGGGAVDSVFGRDGAVVAQAGDYNSDQVTEGSINLFLTSERVQDIVALMLAAGNNVSLTYDDGAGTLTVAVVPAGTDGRVQFNDGGVLGSDGDLVYEKGPNRLNVGNFSSSSDGEIVVGGSGTGIGRITGGGGELHVIGGDLYVEANAPSHFIVFKTNTIERMRIDSSGNVTIQNDLAVTGNISAANLSLYQLISEKGVANGYASLDGAGKVPISQLPSSIMEYKGTWNATTNTPTLVNGTGDTGDVYRVAVAGTHNFGAGNITFDVGDYAIYNGTVWEKSDTTDAVATVFGRLGNVVAANGDYNSDQITPGSTNLFATATNVAAIIHAATQKATPVDNDEFALIDSADSNSLKRLLFSALKTTLAKSNELGKKTIGIQVSDPLGLALTTGDGKVGYRIPPELNGADLVYVAANVSDVPTVSGILVQLRRSRRTNATTRAVADMLSTRIGIDTSEFDSIDGATPAVINTSNDDVQTGDVIYVDVDSAGSNARGLMVTMTFKLP